MKPVFSTTVKMDTIIANAGDCLSLSFVLLLKRPMPQSRVNISVASACNSSLLTNLIVVMLQLIEEAVRLRQPVGDVLGQPIHVRFDEPSFDPAAYDSAYGGHGTAASILESVVDTLVDEEGDGFHESNMMHAVNGYMYCNQPGLEMVASFL